MPRTVNGTGQTGPRGRGPTSRRRRDLAEVIHIEHARERRPLRVPEALRADGLGEPVRRERRVDGAGLRRCRFCRNAIAATARVETLNQIEKMLITLQLCVAYETPRTGPDMSFGGSIHNLPGPGFATDEN